MRKTIRSSRVVPSRYRGRTMQKRYISSSRRQYIRASSSRWDSIIDELRDEYYEQDIDSLYEMTRAGQYIQDICLRVEGELDLFTETSTRGWMGSITFYNNDDGDELATLDIQNFDEAVLNLAVESSSEAEFASRYKRYLENII